MQNNWNTCDYCNEFLGERIDSDIEGNVKTFYKCKDSSCSVYNKEYVL